MQETRQRLAAWVTSGIDKAGKKQDELADLLCVSQPRVSEIQSGKRSIRADELPVIMRYIDEPLPTEFHLRPGLADLLDAELLADIIETIAKEVAEHKRSLEPAGYAKVVAHVYQECIIENATAKEKRKEIITLVDFESKKSPQP